MDRRREMEREAALGRSAADIMGSEALQAAFENCEKQFYKDWIANGLDERKALAAWAKVTALRDVQNELHRIVNRGEHAKATLQSLQ